MGDFEEKLESILNNPQAMQQIMTMAQSLSGTSQNIAPSVAEKSTAPTTPDFQLDPKMLSGIVSLIGQYNSNDDQRVTLLNALRPFVKEKRYTRIDQAIQIAKLSRIARTALETFRTKEDFDHV